MADTNTKERDTTMYKKMFVKVASDAETRSKQISRWENAKIQGAGEGVLGGALGVAGGAAMGGILAHSTLGPDFYHRKLFGKNKAIINAYRSIKHPLGRIALTSAGALAGGLLGGAAIGALSSVNGAARGYLVGSGVNNNANTEDYTENQAKRHAIVGAVTGGLVGSIAGPGGLVLGAANGALSSALGGALSGAIGHKVLKYDKKHKKD